MKSEADSAGLFAGGEGSEGFGGRYVPEVLMAAVDELSEAYDRIGGSAEFQAELDHLLHTDRVRLPLPTGIARTAIGQVEAVQHQPLARGATGRVHAAGSRIR